MTDRAPTSSSSTEPSRPHPFLRAVVADAALWAGMLLLLLLFRALMLALFGGQMHEESGWRNVLRCFGAGFRYDVMVATYAVAPTVLLTLVGAAWWAGEWHDRVRRWLATALVAGTMLIFVVDVGYFMEYHDQFNHWIFGMVFDDRKAILETTWKSYPIVWIVLGLAALVAGTLALGRLAWRRIGSSVELPARLGVGRRRAVVAACVLALLALGARASLGKRPAQLKDAAVTRDPFLDKIVMNPHLALRYAVKHHGILQRGGGLQLILPDGDVKAAARAWFPERGEVADLDEAARRVAKGRQAKAPRHVLLVVMESYDAWPLRPENAELRASERLADIGRRGVMADAFLAATDSTMGSLGALITGLPDAGLHLPYVPSLREGVPTDTAAIFKRLGYRTRFFYGGYLSWYRVGEFCREHGFDETHGGSVMTSELTGNEWGVDDEDLFAFVARSLGEEPTFNLIMTTSYHPPFSVDLEAKGFPEAALAPALAARGFDAEQTRILGHLWYSDQSLGRFVEDVERAHPDALFAVTGDHWSRRAFRARPLLVGQRAVPLALYGPAALEGVPRPPAIAGSHYDVAPTLIELCAPAGFEYHSFGRDLLDPSLPQVGYGERAVVTTELIVDVGAGDRVEDFQGRPAHDRVSADELRQRYRQLSALGWWRVMKGPKL